MKAGNHPFDAGLPRERQTTDGLVLPKVRVVGPLEYHWIVLAGRLINRFVARFPMGPKNLHSLDNGGDVVFDHLAVSVAENFAEGLRYSRVGHLEVQKIRELEITGFFQLVLVRRVYNNPVNKPLLHGGSAVGNPASHINELNVFSRNQAHSLEINKAAYSSRPARPTPSFLPFKSIGLRIEELTIKRIGT